MSTTTATDDQTSASGDPTGGDASGPAAGERPPRPRLVDRIPPGGTSDPDLILDLFLEWVIDIGFELYPAQEEALLELMAGRHVILNTPTGSGKSLVALGLHFKALCEGKSCFYTSPIKALASEKFFDLCDELGAKNVAMLTGDASINRDAPIRTCTAEILSNMALRQGAELDVPYVVMDEFHYYSDPERGVAWQIPLITLPNTVFLLMSATLGNPAPIKERLEEQTRAEAAMVTSVERPVPLDFEYVETALHETVGDLVRAGKAPIYIVNFTQRECSEQAQALTSMKVADRDTRQAIKAALGGFAFDTPYGKELRRYLSFGIGVHHAGLLPKYRLLVEQLSQQGLLKVICGTDTLGVGVNIPIRTVLFTKLAKYDGTSVGILTVRDFQQIAGRAGRRGYDDEGSVVCLAPEHVIENRKLEAKARQGKKVTKKQPPKGYVEWNEETFRKLIDSPPETLESRFRIAPGMILDTVQHDAEVDDPERDNFHSLRRLIGRSHESEVHQGQLISEAAELVRALHRAGILRMARDVDSGYYWVSVDRELQWGFSLLQTLSLYMVELLDVLEPDEPEYALDVLTVVEAILEDPRVILYRQLDRERGRVVAELKAEGVPYEERMEKLEEVTHPKPKEEWLYECFDLFRRVHPWVGGETVHPKSIGREMYEGYYSFNDYVRDLGLSRSEGVLLRYLSQLYKTLKQSVPQQAKTDELYDIEGYLRTLIERTDTSLLEEWESLLHPDVLLAEAEAGERAKAEYKAHELLDDPQAFAARVRAELHQLVRALAGGDYEEAVSMVRHDPDAEPWDAERFEKELQPFLDEYGEIVFTPEARLSHRTVIEPDGPRRWTVSQVLLDPEADDRWCLEGEIDLAADRPLEGPLVALRRIGE